MVLPFAEGRRGRSKEGERQGNREGERGPRLFQLWTVLSRASQTDLKAALRQSSIAASCFMTRNLVRKEVPDTFYLLTLFVYLNKRCLFSHRWTICNFSAVSLAPSLTASHGGKISEHVPTRSILGEVADRSNEIHKPKKYQFFFSWVTLCPCVKICK